MEGVRRDGGSDGNGFGVPAITEAGAAANAEAGTVHDAEAGTANGPQATTANGTRSGPRAAGHRGRGPRAAGHTEPDTTRTEPAASRHDTPRHKTSRAHRARDTALWACLATPVATTELLGLNEPRPLWQRLAGAAVLAVAVAVSRRAPLAAFALTAALSLAAAPALFSLAYAPALATLALLLGLRARRMRPAALCFTALGCAGTARIALLGVDPAPEWLVLMCTLLFCCVFPWLAGRHRRQGRELAEAGWLRAARLEDEQRHTEERARLRERARIAQDMHDSLGHDLSLIALRASVLQVAPDLPTHHRAAVADLRAAAAEATDRLHGVIGVLREDDDEPAPLAPAGETLEQLVARTAESGLPVRWERADTRPAPMPEPGGITERLLHRVVREALTNAARHAPGATVVVTVTGEDQGTAVTVSNGPATQSSSRPTGGGSGLLGLRAAVTAVGGTFAAGPPQEGPYAGGFRVRVWVPERAGEGRRSRTPSVPAPPPGREPVATMIPGREAATATPSGREPAATTPSGQQATTPSGRDATKTTPTRQQPATTARPRPDTITPPEHGAAPFTRARRRAALALWGAGGTGLVLIGVAFAWYAYTETHSVLRPDTYAQLRLGAPAAEIGPLLPDRAVADPPTDRAPAPPPGAHCDYYRSSGELLVSVDHFRLCYDAEDRLIGKDVIPGAGRPGTAHPEEGTAP
ncbi:histidine kinase [Streptomyces sp. NPDC048290]|uniref:sensor histidine kinase n=1 Tax=Streptomyces sp. NPDC048290 TaxID=3155811 RepID=UPI003448738C